VVVDVDVVVVVVDVVVVVISKVVGLFPMTQPRV